MAQTVTSQELGIRLCKSMGLNPDTVKRMDICLIAGETVTVTVHHIHTDQADAISDAIVTYDLVKRDLVKAP